MPAPLSPAVLGIETSGNWCSAALISAGEVHARRAEVGHAHSDHLLSMVEAVLADGSLALAECAAIAFAAGPGSFTGLRVACAVAQGLAFGAALPVAAIGTLDAIAEAVATEESDTAATLLVAMDARMGEVYWSLFRCDDDGHPVALGAPALATPARLRAALDARSTPLPVALGCGDAWAAHGAAMDGLAARVVHRVAADAVDVATLGLRAVVEGGLIAASDAAPLYVRNDVARTTVEREADARMKAEAR